jgi:hypothetical protein
VVAQAGEVVTEAVAGAVARSPAVAADPNQAEVEAVLGVGVVRHHSLHVPFRVQISLQQLCGRKHVDLLPTLLAVDALFGEPLVSCCTRHAFVVGLNRHVQDRSESSDFGDGTPGGNALLALQIHRETDNHLDRLFFRDERCDVRVIRLLAPRSLKNSEW